MLKCFTHFTGKLLLFLYLAAGSYALPGQELVMARHAGSDQPQAGSQESVLLKDALRQLEEEHGVTFTYVADLIADQRVGSAKTRSKGVAAALKVLLEGTGLTFQKVDDRYYVIRPEAKPKATAPDAQSVPKPAASAAESIPATQAATITITGRVTAQENNEALPGVNVLIKGTTVGTTTNAEGRYTLPVPDEHENGTLVFTYIGYTATEVPINRRTQIEIALAADIKSLSEVVVVGYGTQKKVNLTGAVESIDAAEISRRPVAQASAALQGIAPGVTITQRSGQPGRDFGNIRIRGVGTLPDDGKNNPLVLVDGVEMDINSIDPNVIENISVLKDAASAAIYGSRAANGVILVTTKRAKDNLTSVSYSTYIGVQRPMNLPKMVNALDHMRMINEAYTNVGRPALYNDQILNDYQTLGPSNRDLYPDTDWQKQVLTGSGLQQNHFISVNAGTDKLRVLGSLGYLDQKGIIENSRFSRYTFRINTDMTISRKLSALLDLSLIGAKTTEPGRDAGNPGGGASYVIHWMNRIPANQGGILSSGQWGEGWNGDNPIAAAKEGGTRVDRSPTAQLNFTLRYKPLSWLNADLTVAPIFNSLYSKQFVKAVQTYKEDGSPSFLVPSRSNLAELTNRTTNMTIRGLLTAEKTFGNHNLKALAGYSQEDSRNDWVRAFREGFVLPDYPMLNSGAADNQQATGSASEWALRSYFSRVNYDYKGKYLFELNARYDGSSRFARGRKYGLFPSVSAGWRISEEPFMVPLQNVIYNLKLRASWGQLGNQNIGNYPFASFIDLNSNYVLGKQVVGGATLNDMANPEITWETTEMTNLGIDIGLFKSLDLSFDYYIRQTRDILYTLDIPKIIGLNAPFQNAGVVENKGWDLGLSYKGNVSAFRYGVTVALSDVKNKIIDLKGVNRAGLTVQHEGYAMNSIYGLQAMGLFASDDEVAASPKQYGAVKAGDIRYKDQNDDGVITEADNVIVGNTIPRYTYSTTLSASFKGFDLNIFLQGVGKADGYLFGQGIMPFFLGGTVQEQHKDRWTAENPNPNATFPRFAFNEVNNEKHSSFWLKDASYLRLKNLQLGYTFPRPLVRKIRLQHLRLYLTGQNLLTFDRFWDGFDVEAPVGNGGYYPQVKVYTAGLDVRF